jgi:hypothetical protein
MFGTTANGVDMALGFIQLAVALGTDMSCCYPFRQFVGRVDSTYTYVVPADSNAIRRHECTSRSVFNVVVAAHQLLEGSRHLQNCRTVALSVEVHASLLLFRGGHVRYTQLSLVIDTNLCQR